MAQHLQAQNYKRFPRTAWGRNTRAGTASGLTATKGWTTPTG